MVGLINLEKENPKPFQESSEMIKLKTETGTEIEIECDDIDVPLITIKRTERKFQKNTDYLSSSNSKINRDKNENRNKNNAANKNESSLYLCKKIEIKINESSSTTTENLLRSAVQDSAYGNVQNLFLEDPDSDVNKKVSKAYYNQSPAFFYSCPFLFYRYVLLLFTVAHLSLSLSLSLCLSLSLSLSFSFFISFSMYLNTILPPSSLLIPLPSQLLLSADHTSESSIIFRRVGHSLLLKSAIGGNYLYASPEVDYEIETVVLILGKKH